MTLTLKRKKNIITPTPSISYPAEACEAFMKACHKLEGKKLSDFIYQQYDSVLGTLPPDGIMYRWLQVRIAYKLLEDGYKRLNIEPSRKLQERFTLSHDFKNYTKLEETLPSLKGETNMTTKKEVTIKSRPKPKSKTSTLRVHEGWCQILSENHKLKLSDKALAVKMCKLFPDKKAYTEADVAAHRSMWNNGRIKGQVSKPKTRLERSK